MALSSLERVAIIGGGRWARVLTTVVGDIVPPTTAISIHSSHNAEGMASWANALVGARAIYVSPDWPDFPPGQRAAVIVANATRDHEASVERLLAAGVPVLVEKPMALDAVGAERLATLARHGHGRLAPAHVFLFARYIEWLAQVVVERGGARSILIQWTDPRQERRYGEQKRYDASVPIFVDVFPHVASVLSVLLPTFPERCVGVTIRKGGAEVDVELVSGQAPCCVRLARHGECRIRVVEVETERGTVVLDFSEEPGRIVCGPAVVDADPEWHTATRPLARLVTAFLTWAGGGAYDPRLDVQLGIQSCRLADDVLVRYRSLLASWLIGQLGAMVEADDAVRYALSEVLQTDGPLSPSELDRQISGVVRDGAVDGILTILDNYITNGVKGVASDAHPAADRTTREVLS